MQHRKHQYRSADFSVGSLHEFLGAFGRQGGSPALLSKVTENESIMRRLVNFMALDGWEATTSQQVATEIMGPNCFGIGEAIRYFGVKPTKSQLCALAEVPFTEKVLRECRETHILVAFFPHSIYDLWKKEPSLVSSPTADGHPYERHSFAKERGRAGWHLIQKTPVEGSLNKLINEQQKLLGENNFIPSARVLTYAAVGHYRNTGERLFGKIFISCADRDKNKEYVRVGYFEESDRSFCITSWRGEHRSPTTGLAAERKPTHTAT